MEFTYFTVLFTHAKETHMNGTAQPPTMDKMQLERFAFQILSNLFLRGEICIEAIKNILKEKGIYQRDITLFATRLLQQNTWWQRRCEELSLQAILELMKQSLKNREIILDRGAELMPSTATWESFSSTCLKKMSTPPREAKDTILEL